MKSRILLVEDDTSLGYILKEYLTMHELDVTLAQDGNEGLRLFKASPYDLIVLDVMMPGLDGFDLGKQIKSIDSVVPLIYLTAKSLKVDKLKGFKIGCDDYIVKPVDEEELIARIHAVLNRSGKKSHRVIPHQYLIGNLSFDAQSQQLKGVNYQQILTSKESRILEMLCMEKGTLVQREKMLKELWGESDFFNRRSMDVFISKLRKYLHVDPSISIINVHGKGFILEDRESA